jgi:zinc transport system substrate-binding protein
MARTILPGLGWIAVIVIACLAGCEKKSGSAPQSQIAVANSYLEAAVLDLGVDPSKVMSFVPPGMCPGHFDLTPSQVEGLLSCSVLLVFDFQNNISSSLPRVRESGLTIGVIAPPPGLCVPDSYLSIVRQAAAALESANLLSSADSAARLQAIEKRMKGLEQEIRSDMERAGLRDGPILVSKHQEVFARWLGLNPVGTFRGSDAETPGPIQTALENAAKQPVRWVIANQQEGTELAQSLAKRLSVGLVIFSNFPNSTVSEKGQPTFDALVRENVARLIEAAR